MKRGVRKLKEGLKTSPEPKRGSIKSNRRVSSTVSSTNQCFNYQKDASFLYMQIAFIWKSSFLSISKSCTSTGKMNRLSRHLTPWWESPSLKLKLSESTNIFQR